MSFPKQRDPSFDARWTAWLARGVAHDRAVRRRFAIGTPFVVVAVLMLADMFRIR